MSDSESRDNHPTRSGAGDHAASESDSFLSDDCSDALDATTAPDELAAPSVRIGRYKLLQQIGEGGMGSVWMAQQESPVRRRVAIKLVRAGMDSKLVLARFEAERQALAMMEHANIAKVFDAGTSDDGKPYFVMELVQGPPITKYCDKNQLSMRERLELFIPVCQAVHHAHQKGIIHRDLKPSNVMVGTQDGKPVPKVIDFGLAKAQQHQMQLTDKTLFTEFGQVVGTVQYMSPEQAVLDVHDVDTRSDIYALGVLLYELLTGSTPLQRSMTAEMPILKILSMVRDSDPPRPSDRVSSIGESISEITSARQTDSQRLKQTLSGDLDWIVMKALDKDRERRFGSAAGFAEDIRRYLDDEPIEARPPSASYRIGKFARKHRVLMAASTTFLLLLLAGIAGTTWFAIAAERSRETAEEALVTAEQETVRAKTAETRADEQARRAKEATELAQARLARSDYWVALSKFREGSVSHGYDLLENIPERYRNFEWHYDHNHFQHVRLSFRAGRKSIEHMHLRPDGKWFSAIGGQTSLYLFDSKTGAKIDLRGINRKGIFDACWSPDGKLLGLMREDRVDFHDATSLEFLKSVPVESRPFEELKFAADSKSIFYDFKGKLDRVSYDNGKVLWTAELDGRWGIRSVALSEDGSLLAAGRSRGRVDVYETDNANGEISHQFQGSKETRWLAFSPDGSILAIPQGTTNLKVDLVNPRTGEKLRSIDTGNHNVVEVAFSPDSKRLLTAGLDTRVNLWDVETGKLLKSFSVHSFPVRGICWFENGTSFISGDRGGNVRFTDIESNHEEAILQQDGYVRAVSIRESDGLIASGNGRYVSFRNADHEEKRSLKVHKKLNVEQLSFSADGQLLAVTDSKGLVALWNPDSRKLIREFKKHSERITSLAFTPDGSKLVTGDYGGEVFVWDVATGELLWSLEGHVAVFSVACSPDGKLIATSSWDEKVYLWDAETGRRVHSVKFNRGSREISWFRRFSAMTFSPDSRYLFAGTQDSEVYYFNCETGQEEGRFFSNSRSIEAITFNPDGSRLFIGSNDWTVRIWDPETFEEIRVLTGHTGSVESLIFNSEGSKLYSASDDDTVRVWDATLSPR
ncbi:protein kinase [bacterium]|nr:protein kinase [bacterium]